MRKNFIMSLFAMLLTVITLSAQNNTYTMVIEMQNGTKVNIGPNEVKNISFNNGQVVFSGNTIAEIVKQTTSQQGYATTDELKAAVANLNTKVDNANTTINTDISSLWNELQTLQKKVQKLAGEPETQETVYYGFAASSSISSVSGLSKVIKTSLQGWYKSTNSDFAYWWLVYPSSWDYNEIKSSGIGVDLASPQSVTIGGKSYTALRTTNELAAKTWNFEVD